MKIRAYGMTEINVEAFTFEELQEASTLINARLEERRQLRDGSKVDRDDYFRRAVKKHGPLLAMAEHRRLMGCSLLDADKYVRNL